MFNDKKLNADIQILFDLATNSENKIVTAESCSGGLIATLIVRVPGASKIFERGFITYSNEAKTELLGVSEESLKKYGAVSRQVAEEMARGAVKNSNANLSIAVTGIAGPANENSTLPGIPVKPAGLVFIASYNKLNENLINNELHFSGDRDQIMLFSAQEAIKILIQQISVR
jgi:PncC family amidohydrolase